MCRDLEDDEAIHGLIIKAASSTRLTAPGLQLLNKIHGSIKFKVKYLTNYLIVSVFAVFVYSWHNCGPMRSREVLAFPFFVIIHRQLRPKSTQMLARVGNQLAFLAQMCSQHNEDP